MHAFKLALGGGVLFTTGAAAGLALGGIAGFLAAAYVFTIGAESEKETVKATMDEAVA